jgi:endo-1,4-beta-xylanase
VLTTTTSAFGAGLDTAAVAIGKLYFGTATDNPELTDAAYVKQLNNTDDFGQITPGNSQKVNWLFNFQNLNTLTH